MTFRVGMKVVCVDDVTHTKYIPAGFGCSDLSLHGLTCGRVYTVRSLGVFHGVPTCRVEEITRPIESLFGEEAWFASARFRPTVERKTDISCFTKLLNPSLADMRALIRETVQ